MGDNEKDNMSGCKENGFCSLRPSGKFAVLYTRPKAFGSRLIFSANTKLNKRLFLIGKFLLKCSSSTVKSATLRPAETALHTAIPIVSVVVGRWGLL